MAYVMWGMAGVLVAALLVPLSKVPHGAVRGWEFPREQFCILGFVLAGISAVWGIGGWALGALFCGLSVVQLAYIAKFTPVWPRQSADADADLRGQADRCFSVIATNVKQSNRAYDRLTALLLQQQEAACGDTYPHWVRVPQDNGYGLAVASRLPLREVEVRRLVTQDVPSIRAVVRLNSGDDMRLYVVHPEPPIASHDTLGRDGEIALIGLEAKADPLPAVVTGDLNDVAWSTTTRRFQRLSGLLDPRVGRGFFNTFNALVPLMRWPLDHLFHDARFRLVGMSRLPKIGSDHFPMRFDLALARSEKALTSPGAANGEERAEVRDMIRTEQARPRSPIGEDWEDE